MARLLPLFNLLGGAHLIGCRHHLSKFLMISSLHYMTLWCRILARVEVFVQSSVQLATRIPSFSAPCPRQTRCQLWDMWPRVANSLIRFETL